jgi:hypothetical protein
MQVTRACGKSFSGDEADQLLFGLQLAFSSHLDAGLRRSST